MAPQKSGETPPPKKGLNFALPYYFASFQCYWILCNYYWIMQTIYVDTTRDSTIKCFKCFCVLLALPFWHY